MKTRILKYIFLTISLLTLLQSPATANVIFIQPTAKENAKIKRQYRQDRRAMEIQEPVVSSITVSADLFGYMYSIFSNGISWSELTFDIGFKKQFYPTIEAGFAKSDSESKSKNGITYYTKAPYFRIGMDYNMQHHKHRDYFIVLGFRYGYSSFDYTVNGMHFSNPYHGSDLDFNISNAHATAHWGELIFGLRSMFWKNIGMSWSLRYKFPFSITKNEYSKPWYVPGYGINRESAIMGTYKIMFGVPFKKKL